MESTKNQGNNSILYFKIMTMTFCFEIFFFVNKYSELGYFCRYRQCKNDINYLISILILMVGFFLAPTPFYVYCTLLYKSIYICSILYINLAMNTP